MKNLETGEEQIKLAYFRNGRWDEITVPKTMITSANKIVALSGRGISVTSENAKLLVKYLSDVENLNDDYIAMQYSSSKLGWHGQEFLPYDTDIVFDGDFRFKNIFDAITERGSAAVWLEHIRSLRRSGRMEVKFLLAASFASVLLQPLGGLPFFVDLWGETEGGKTVSLMVAASVWANPDESQYIGDFKSTDVALEAKADMLNNLPMLLDDTSKTSARIRDNFEGVVYDLCSGKGKSRSNKDLGINRENRWRNVIICNGERPLSAYVEQGGAINRIIEVECGEKVFQDPGKTADIVKKNYGYAGKAFIAIIKKMGIEKIRAVQEVFKQELQSNDKMEKQALSLSIVLTADRIATEYIFNASLNTGGATAVSNAGKIARNIVTAFKPAITGARTSGQTIGQNFASAISSKSGAVSGASRRLVSAVRSALSNVSTYQYGVYIGQGLANGIWSQLGNVRAAANALVAQAERAIRAKAMIHSPSKLTYQLGEYFGEGFTNGIENLTKDAWKAASDLVSIPAVNVPQMALAGWDTTLNDEYFYNDSAEYVIYVPVEIDGKEVATVTAPYTEAELAKRQKYRNRKQGIR